MPRSAPLSLRNGQNINNERLEYLGDAVLDAIVAEVLFYHYPTKDEGFLSQMRSRIVKRKQLDKLAVKLGIDRLVYVSYHNNGGKHVYGNALEALVGAIFLDKGFNSARKFVRFMFKKHIHLETIEKIESDYKSRIIEWAQKNKVEIRFECQEEYAVRYNKMQFIVTIYINGVITGQGDGFSKKEAEQNASEQAYYELPAEL